MWNFKKSNIPRRIYDKHHGRPISYSNPLSRSTSVRRIKTTNFKDAMIQNPNGARVDSEKYFIDTQLEILLTANGLRPGKKYMNFQAVR